MALGSLVLARLVSYALLLAMAGLPFYALVHGRRVLSAPERMSLAILMVGALGASLWWAVADVAEMAGLPVGDLDQETFSAVLGATPLGALLAARAAMLAAFGALLALAPMPLLLTMAALPALASVAWAGHAGAGEGAPGLLLRASDILHLAAASLWTGALLAFLSAIRRQRQRADLLRSLSDFARVGTAVVATLFVTGLLNIWFISARQWPSGRWPLLIALKFVLFLAMLGFAAHNRWRMVPALAEGRPGAALHLRRSLVLETACAFAIVAVVALAGQLDPHGG